MEDFKKIVKMKCGGSVAKAKEYCYGGKTMKKGGEVDAADIKQDKAIVKKAFKMHDEQEHGGERTDLSKLKKGGRSKKEAGTVRKYKTGGAVENAYGAKKTDKDITDIANAKRQKPALLCGGKSVKKMQVGGSSGPLTGAARALADSEQLRQLNRLKNARKYLGPDQQAQAVSQGVLNPAPANVPAPAQTTMPATDEMGNPTGQKRGGKVKRAK